MTFDHLLAMLQSNYRQAIDDDEARVYQRELAGVSLDDLELAMRYSIRTRKFFPNVAELLEDLAAVREANPSIAREFEPCEKCINGWIPAPSREVPVLAGYDAEGKAQIEKRPGGLSLQRCPCWTNWRRAQGLAVPAPKPTRTIDKNRAIGAHAWNSTSEIAASSNKVARFKQRAAKR